MLAAHVPDDSEEWMRYELSKLTQFTRIFPPEPLAPRERGEGQEDLEGREEDNEEDADEDGEGNNGSSAAGASAEEKQAAAAKAKATPIEEILFQVAMT